MFCDQLFPDYGLIYCAGVFSLDYNSLYDSFSNSEYGSMVVAIFPVVLFLFYSVGILSFVSIYLFKLKNKWGHLISRFILALTAITIISIVIWALMRETEVINIVENEKSNTS